jgi:hypothetical protein
MASSTLSRFLTGMMFSALLVAASFAGAHLARSASTDLRIASADEETDLRRDLDRVRGDVRALRSSTGAVALADPTKAASKGDRPSAPSSLGDQVKIHRQILADLDARYVREERDGTWSDESDAAIRRAFSPTSTPGSRIKEIACRTSICRAVIKNDDVNVQRELPKIIAMRAPFTDFKGGLYYLYSHNPELTTIYMLRAPYEPRAEPR